MHFVYIVRCADGSLYVGESADPTLREQMHNEGRGGRYTARRRPVHTVLSESFATREAALHRERQLKGWTVAKKESLIRSDAQRLKDLSKRRR